MRRLCVACGLAFRLDREEDALECVGCHGELCLGCWHGDKEPCCREDRAGVTCPTCFGRGYQDVMGECPWCAGIGTVIQNGLARACEPCEGEGWLGVRLCQACEAYGVTEEKPSTARAVQKQVA